MLYQNIYHCLNEHSYISRRKFLNDCIDILGEDLVSEAWETKLAEDALNYAIRLNEIAEDIAKDNNFNIFKRTN